MTLYRNPERLLPGERIKVVDGSFVGEVGEVISRQKAVALWKRVGGEKPGLTDDTEMVWVQIPVFDQPVPVLLHLFQVERIAQ
jgi:hypothetical protein